MRQKPLIKRFDRLDPLGRGDYLSIQHIERYRFACTLLQPGQKVLDIACGTGYGTAMLLQRGCKVVGADIDNEILKEARMRWNYDGFVQADALDLPFPDASFDAVVSFETIEHVADGERFLAEMRRVLRPGGIFICSTPNVRYTAHPSCHVKEYEPDEFFKLVESYFANVKHYGQYFRMMDRLRDLLRWHIRSKIVRLLEITYLKLWIKKLIGRAKRDSKKSFWAPDVYGYNTKCDAVRSISFSYYKVRPIISTRLLRIMIAVGSKK